MRDRRERPMLHVALESEMKAAVSIGDLGGGGGGGGVVVEAGRGGEEGGGGEGEG